MPTKKKFWMKGSKIRRRSSCGQLPRLSSCGLLFYRGFEPLLDWLLIRVDILGDCYLKELDQFLLALSNGNLKRLELVIQPKAWELPDREEAYPPVYSLVFQWGEQGISCLYFDDLHNIFYALRQDDKRPRTNAECLVNISQDKPLPFCCQFASFFPLQCRLQEILDVLRIHTRQGAVPSEAGEFLWTEAWGGVHIGSQRNKYNLAKQDLGGFPLERAMIQRARIFRFLFLFRQIMVCKNPHPFY